MSEPTQAQVKKTIARLRADMKYQESIGRDCYAENVTMKDVLIVCTAAEHSLAPATPTHLALFDKLRDEWNGEIEPGQPCFDTFSACLAGLSDAIEKSRAAAPPATQTGDVRKVSAAMIRKSLQGCKRTFDVRLNGLTDEGIEVLCSVLSGELNAELAASAAPTPESTGADEIVEACAELFSDDAVLTGLSAQWAVRALKGKFTLAAQPGQKGED
jgi:hypothetical protein